MQSRSSAAESPEISLLIPVKVGDSGLEEHMAQVEAFFAKFFPGAYEIIAIINGDEAYADCERLSGLRVSYPQLRLLPCLEAGKGLALKAGFAVARGRFVFMTDADLPYDLEFFSRAYAALVSGYDFVSGNRRLLNSTFTVPTSLLHLVYRRHKLGLLFNTLVARLILRIPSTDTQAGIKAMSREFAELAFGRQTSPGFFADLEYFFACYDSGFRHIELPLHFYLRDEKSTVHLTMQLLATLVWLPRLFFARARGQYRLQHMGNTKRFSIWWRIIKRLDLRRLRMWTALCARWALTPYSKIITFLPRRGRIFDVACGHGLLGLLLATRSSELEVLGVDKDQLRLTDARILAHGLSNLSFQEGCLKDKAPQPYDAMTVMDALHLLSPEEQKDCMANAFAGLRPGGVLLIRVADVSSGGWRLGLRRSYEFLVRHSVFAASSRAVQSQRTPEAWQDLAKQAGFHVWSEICSSLFFTDRLFICRKPLLHEAKARFPVFAADDWGLSPGVNEGILELARKGVLRRVSILVDGAYSHYLLQELSEVKGLELGLHFALTFGDQMESSKDFRSPRAFIRFLLNPLLSQAKKKGRIAKEFSRQLAKLRGLGIEPYYLDGHHHVHRVPVVASAIATLASVEALPHHVRRPYDPRAWFSKKAIINVMAILSARSYSNQRALAFSYPSLATMNDPWRLARLVQKLTLQTEIIVHPAKRDDLKAIGSSDSYTFGRVQEYHSLMNLQEPLALLQSLQREGSVVAYRSQELVPSI